LYELSQALGATLTVRDAMVSLTSRLAGLVPFTTCALFVREGDTGRTLCRAVGGRESEKYTLIATEFVEGPVAWVIDNERSLVTNLPAASPRRPAGSAPPPPLVEVLLCPLRADGQTFGAFAVYHHRRGSYGDDQRRVLEQVCDILGAAVQNSLRYERTHQAALTDGLTGLPNSRGLAAGFERALARAAHEQQPLAVLMTDLNGFKDVNDSYGHDVGDRALKEVSRVLFHAIRPSDLCARYAGDEFVILLSNCDARQAARRAEELRREIASLHFEPAPGTVVPLGISVGAAVFPDDGRTLEAMLIAADRRMYADKTSARRSPERAARDSSGAPLRSKSADSDPAAPVAVSATTSPIDDGNPPSATPDTANVG
jgi:diguanylate cyclase (GGDEF)-like protein